MRRLALLALAFSLPIAASAQKDPAKPGADTAAPDAPAMTLPDTLRPGDLDLSGLPEGETTYTVRLLAPMQQDIGTITETTTRAGDALTRASTVAIPMAGQNEASTAVVDATTYAFRSVTMEGSTGAGTMTLENGVVTGERAIATEPGPLPEPAAVNDALDGEVFGSGWAFALPHALPLTEGVYHVATYSARDGAVVERVSVLAPEALKPGGGAAVTYVPVETFDGEQTMTYYVDPETRRVELVRFSPQAGVEVEFDRD